MHCQAPRQTSPWSAMSGVKELYHVKPAKSGRMHSIALHSLWVGKAVRVPELRLISSLFKTRFPLPHTPPHSSSPDAKSADAQSGKLTYANPPPTWRQQQRVMAGPHSRRAC